MPGDRFLRWQLATGADDGRAGAGDPSGAWLLGRAWARLDRFAGRGSGAGAPVATRRLVVAGDAVDAAHLLGALVADGLRPDRVSLVRGAVDVVAPALRPVGGDDWDWFWTSGAPPRPLSGEGAVVPLETDCDAVAAELLALLRADSPRFSRDPRTAGARWWGIRNQDGDLVAAVAAEPLPRAVHLASLVTRAPERGRGVAAALTSAVTRRALADGREAVVLGMYADNEVARGIYGRLGFVLSHRWRSGLLAGQLAGHPNGQPVADPSR